MGFDLVHDIQSAYRKLMDSMSRPGLICNINSEASCFDIDICCFKSTSVLIFMLLDTEVTFKVYSKNETDTARLINQLTYSKTAACECADFIFIMSDAFEGALEEAISRAYQGSLTDPHKSATIIVEQSAVRKDGDIILSGPGIEHENTAGLSTQYGWIQKRAEKNSEYPLGVDMIFVDSSNNFLCIPRTTTVKRKVVA